MKCFFLEVTRTTGERILANAELISVIVPGNNSNEATLLLTEGGDTAIRESYADVVRAIEENGGKVIKVGVSAPQNALEPEQQP